MAPDDPGMGGFFPGMLGDLLRLLKTDAPFPYELAQQLAETVASEGDELQAVDPLDRIRLEELARLAELQVADVTGMTTTVTGRPVVIVPTTRPDWARRNLDAWRPVLEEIAAVLIPKRQPPVERRPDGEGADLAAFVGQWASAIAPAMVAMQFGSVVGHLSQRALGQYELPLPRPSSDELLVVAQNDRSFAEDWSLALNDVFYVLVIQDVALHAVMSRPHVSARLRTLLVERARGFQPDPHALEERMADASIADASDLSELTRLLGDPAALGAMSDSPEMRRVQAELAAFSAVLGGYCAWVSTTATARSIGAGGPVREALRRRLIERNEEERTADALFGIALDQEAIERGGAFVRGVLERGGESELAKLWVVEANLPTPSEVDAPGLWIERVNLPPHPTSGADPTPESDLPPDPERSL